MCNTVIRDLWSYDLLQDLAFDLTYSSSLTYHPNTKTSIGPTLTTNRRCYWLATLVARRGYHQFIDQRSKTSMNIAIILIDFIYMEFYECWSSGTLIAKLHLKPMKVWSSLLLAYQLITVPTPSQSGGLVRKAFGQRRGYKWSGKRMAG